MALVNRLPSASAFGQAVATDEEYAARILQLPEEERRAPSGPRVADWSLEVALLGQLVEQVQRVVSSIEWLGTHGERSSPVVPVPRPVTALELAQERARRARLSSLVDEVLAASARAGGGGG